VFVLANLISFIRNQHLPVHPESTAQFFQAQLLASGKLAEPVNFSREFFEFPLLQLDTRWYSDLPPGQSLLLALGQKLGVPWLINPLLGCLAVFVLYLLAAQIYGPPTALLATLFMVFSPMYLSLSAGYLNHLLFILLLLLALLFYYYGISTPGKLYPNLSGLCWGLAALTQPFPALVLTLPFVLYLIKQALSRRPVFWLKLLLMLAGLFIPILLLGKYYQALLGNLWGLSAGYNLGAWLTKGLKAPTEGLFFLMHNLFNLNKELWGWLIPAFFLVLVWVWASSRLETWDYLLLWAVICLLGFNFLSYDTRFGLANPLIVAIPFLVLLSARATTALPAVLDRFGFPPNDTKPLLALGLVTCCLVLLAVRITPLLQPGDGYRPNFTDLIRSEKINNAIIFLNRDPFLETFAYNSPNLKNDIIFARHLKKYNYKLMQEFPQRNYYFYNEGDNKLVPLSPRKE
jgi:4-amino-4-deoxy-L-arabinose transferase-like glycosyltransferase